MVKYLDESHLVKWLEQTRLRPFLECIQDQSTPKRVNANSEMQLYIKVEILLLYHAKTT